jgi:protocatechuate 3,4-dioxygenase alpha subunit
MSAEPKLIPSSSQTVGPFFAIGLEYLIDNAPATELDAADAIVIRGKVLDRDGAPVPDAMLEFWSADNALPHAPSSQGFPRGFRRAATGLDGDFSVVMSRPSAVALDNGRMQVRHMLVLVFARGLLRHLISRVYFEDDPALASDPVLQSVPLERRGTLIARRDGENSFCWDVILQGADETVFFAW